MAITDGDRLRKLLGETIPAGGGPDDTLFSEEEINDLIATYPDWNTRTLAGWKQKAAELANLVNTAESGAKRDLGDLFDQAMKMVTFYGGDAGGVIVDPVTGPGRVKIRNLTRTPKV